MSSSDINGKIINSICSSKISFSTYSMIVVNDQWMIYDLSLIRLNQIKYSSQPRIRKLIKAICRRAWMYIFSQGSQRIYFSKKTKILY